MTIMAAGVLAVTIGCAPPQAASIPPARAFSDAKMELYRQAQTSDPFSRCNAIEALGETLGMQAGEIYLNGLPDQSPAVRFASAMAVGDTKYAPAKGRLMKMVEDKQVEPDRRVMPAVIYALYRMGDTTYTGDLYTLLFDTEKEVRANAALVMGKIGEPSAIGPLKTRLSDEQDPSVRLQVIESLALLGDAPSALSLEAYTKKTRFLDEQLVAIPAMARVHTTTAPQVLNEILNSSQHPTVRVSAAGALGMLGVFSQNGYRYCLEAAKNPEAVLRSVYGKVAPISPLQINMLQRLAVISLGWMNNTSAVDVLHGLLYANVDNGVKIAAAMSILRLLPGYQETPIPAAAKGPATIPVMEATAPPAEGGLEAKTSAGEVRPIEATGQPSARPALKTGEEPAEKVAEKPAEKSAEKTATRPSRPAPGKAKLRTSGGKD